MIGCDWSSDVCSSDLDVIADRLHYNPNYLSNVFKKETGEKFGDFVQNHRLEVAKKWLKIGRASCRERV